MFSGGRGDVQNLKNSFLKIASFSYNSSDSSLISAKVLNFYLGSPQTDFVEICFDGVIIFA